MQKIMRTTMQTTIQKMRLISLSVVIVLALVAGSGAAAESAEAIIIYNPVPGVFDAVVDGFVLQMVENLGYDSPDQLDVTIATNGDELAAALDVGANLVLSVPGGAVFGAGVDLGDVPVIFVLSVDPLGEKLVESLEVPGGNVTGIMVNHSADKRFDLVLQLVPDADTVYVIMGENTRAEQLTAVEMVAADLGVTLNMAEVDLAEGIGELPDDVDAIFLITPPFNTLDAELPMAAMEAGLPLVMDSSMILTSPFGPVMAFGPDMETAGQQAADLAAQILLEGMRPGELPVEEAEAFLTIDLRVADQIELDVSDQMLRMASVMLTDESAGELPTADDSMAAAEGGACNATLIHPGGRNAVCLDVPCDVPLDAGFIRYEDREPVAECGTDALVGTCAMEAFNMLHYDGEISAVQRGCSMLMGQWVDLDVSDTAEEPADDAADEPADDAADDVSADDGASSDDEGTACNATLIHPGGKNAVCLDVPCDVPLDAGFIRYEDREPVAECGTDELVGTCAMEAFNMLHYDGEISAVQRGCSMLMGQWVDLEASDTAEEPADDAADEPADDAADDVSADDGASSDDEGAACNATLIHPGGRNAVCLDVPCDVPLDAGFIRYEDRESVAECGTDTLVGTCAMEAFNMLHYDGEISAVQRGCMMLMGTWQDAE